MPLSDFVCPLVFVGSEEIKKYQYCRPKLDENDRECKYISQKKKKKLKKTLSSWVQVFLNLIS